MGDLFSNNCILNFSILEQNNLLAGFISKAGSKFKIQFMVLMRV